MKQGVRESSLEVGEGGGEPWKNPGVKKLGVSTESSGSGEIAIRGVRE